MESKVKLGSSDKDDWLKNHTLSKEQFKQLVLNKYQRAMKDRENYEKVKHLVRFD